jgi:hypothetical protein
VVGRELDESPSHKQRRLVTFFGVRDNSRDNKRLAILVQIVSARQKIPAYGTYGRFDHTPDKVEGLVRLLPGGGSSPLGRMKKALLMQGFFVSSLSRWISSNYGS